MGGVNEGIQLAAALDRRGVRVSVDLDRVVVHIDRYARPMVIRSRKGTDWSWEYQDQEGSYPRADWEAAAEAVEKFLRGLPALVGTELLHRMDHMGMTWEQECEEALERARHRNATASVSPGHSRPRETGTLRPARR